MAYWIKINYERDLYVIDLDHVSAFVYAANGRLTFWLPDSGLPIILNEQSSPDAYQALSDYICKKTGYASAEFWIKINYDRHEYVINLDRISSFACNPVGKLSFCLPDSGTPVVINRQSNLEAYQKVIDYIEKKTGHSLL